MDQCIAITKAGNQCKRPAVEDCAGYCRQHFDELPPATQQAALKQSKRKRLLRRSGRVIGRGVGIGATIKDLWDLVSPFLSLRQRDHFEKLLQSDIPTKGKIVALNELVIEMGKAQFRGRG